MRLTTECQIYEAIARGDRIFTYYPWSKAAYECQSPVIRTEKGKPVIEGTWVYEDYESFGYNNVDSCLRDGIGTTAKDAMPPRSLAVGDKLHILRSGQVSTGEFVLVLAVNEKTFQGVIVRPATLRIHSNPHLLAFDRETGKNQLPYCIDVSMETFDETRI